MSNSAVAMPGNPVSFVCSCGNKTFSLNAICSMCAATARTDRMVERLTQRVAELESAVLPSDAVTPVAPPVSANPHAIDVNEHYVIIAKMRAEISGLEQENAHLQRRVEILTLQISGGHVASSAHPRVSAIAQAERDARLGAMVRNMSDGSALRKGWSGFYEYLVPSETGGEPINPTMQPEEALESAGVKP